MRPIDADSLLEQDPEICADYGPEYGCEFGYSRDQIRNAPTLSPDDVRGVGCEVCNYDKPLPQEGLSHDFYIHDGAIYHYDSELGWEGTDIAFCPFCGKLLRMKGAEDKS